jgi:hypothetical protein
MGWLCLDDGSAEPPVDTLNPLFVRRKRLSVTDDRGGPDSAPNSATDTHTDANFNKFKLNLSCVCDALRFPSRIRLSAVITRIYIKEYIEQMVKGGGRGLQAAVIPAYPHGSCHLRRSQNIKGAGSLSSEESAR